MKLQKFRWSKVYESGEAELVEFLETRNISAKHWPLKAEDEPGQRFLETATTLWCAEGSFKLWTDGNSVSMQPGDGVKIPAESSIKLEPGMFDSVIYESSDWVPGISNETSSV